MVRNLLLVEPHPETKRFLQEKFRASNLSVRTVADGADALEALRQNPIDLVVCSLEIGPPRGVEMVDRMQGEGIRTPVIFLSRALLHPPEVASELRARGPYEILERPIFLNHLYQRIEARLQTKIDWNERRLDERVSLQLDVLFTLPGEGNSTLTHRVKTVDLSQGGLQFERRVCDVCTGYERGGVHPDCILAPHSVAHGTTQLTVRLATPEGTSLLLPARVVYTLIEEGSSREFVGVRFEDLAPGVRDRLRRLIRRSRPEPTTQEPRI